jgi:hypothetical protein
VLRLVCDTAALRFQTGFKDSEHRLFISWRRCGNIWRANAKVGFAAAALIYYFEA